MKSFNIFNSSNRITLVRRKVIFSDLDLYTELVNQYPKETILDTIKYKINKCRESHHRYNKSKFTIMRQHKLINNIICLRLMSWLLLKKKRMYFKIMQIRRSLCKFKSKLTENDNLKKIWIIRGKILKINF